MDNSCAVLGYVSILILNELRQNLEQIGSNFWFVFKYTSALSFYIIVRNGALNNDDCKFKIAVNAEKHWKYSVPKYQVFSYDLIIYVLIIKCLSY